MNEPPQLSRRTLIAGAAATIAATAAAVAAGTTASGAEPPVATVITDIPGAASLATPKPAKRESLATVVTTPTAEGKVMFPMGTTPRCAILANFGDARSGNRRHEGIDILATKGQPVYAPSAGTLTVQYVDGQANASLSGNAWGLEGTDGNYYFFAHLSGFADGVQLGQQVVRGQLLGFVGDTGNPGVDNFHLHFEIHPGGMKKSAVDPLSLLDVPKACSVT